MKSFMVFFLLGVLVFPAFAGQETNVRKAILGNDPRFDATISTSPLNQFIKNIYRPDSPSSPAEVQVPYEEAVPFENGYYPDEGRYYENPTPHESPPKEEKSYYEGGGRYYPPPEKEEKIHQETPASLP